MLRSGLCALALVCAVVPPARAEVITIRCPEVTATNYEMSGGAITETQTRTVEFDGIQLNLATGEFRVGDVSGVFVERDGAFVAMAHNEPYYGAWEVNRTTGRYSAVGHTANADGSWTFIRHEGQCLGPNMVVPF